MNCAFCHSPFEGREGQTFCRNQCFYDSMKSAPRTCRGCQGPLPGRLRTQYCSKTCEIASRRTQVAEPDPVPGARWVALTKGKFALVDEEDFERVSAHSWYTHVGKSTMYARSWTTLEDGRKPLRLHHFVLNLTPGSGMLVDHKDHDGLNCRKDNLRIVTDSQNRMNTLQKGGSTPYKGVAALPNGYFKATIRANNVGKYLGRFRTAEDAARAYDAEARKMHGAHGRYNFPEPGERAAKI